MGQLTEQLKTAKQELNKALEQRNEYERRLATIRTDKRMTAIEREREAEVIKSFVEAYEEDAEQARQNVLSVEVEFNKWLDEQVKVFSKNRNHLAKEVHELQVISQEFNERLEKGGAELKKLYSIIWMVENTSKSELLSEDTKEHWRVKAEELRLRLSGVQGGLPHTLNVNTHFKNLF